MNTKRFIFCALDFTDLKKTLDFTEIIKNNVGGIKLGLEFFSKNGPQGVEKMKKFGLPIFLDLKLHDIPNTVKQSLKNVLSLEPDFLTVHLSGGYKMIEVLNDIKKHTKIIGVSLLTSLDNEDLKNMGINLDPNEFVEHLVKIGVNAGIDGIVSSAEEVNNLKKKFNDLIFVTPGIRLSSGKVDDQKRIKSPRSAIASGSDLLVIGRPITESKNPVSSINEIINNIENG
jgi:orotidine-5'-phosphate decarboxylase